MMMKRAVEENPGCDGIVLGGHGLFTWGETQRECYLNTLTVIDRSGQFIERHGLAKGTARFGGEAVPARADRQELAVEIAPFLRGRVSAQRRWIAQLHRCAGRAAVRQFGRTRRSWRSWAPAAPITSSAPRSGRCLCRGSRTKTGSAEAADRLSLAEYREQYARTTRAFATPDSPATARCQSDRGADSGHGHVQLRQEQDRGAHHRRVLHQRHSRDGRREPAGRRRSDRDSAAVRPGMDPASFKVFTNYVALPALEAFRIEYWALEEAKIRRQPPEKELSRPHRADRGRSAAASAAKWRCWLPSAARTWWSPIAMPRRAARGGRGTGDRSRRRSSVRSTRGRHSRPRSRFAQALDATIAAFGGVDILINTAAIFPSSPDGVIRDGMWADDARRERDRQLPAGR